MIVRWLRYACAAIALVMFAAPAAAQKANWPKSMTLGTASVGGTFFIYGQVWATLAGDAIGVPISTQQTQGPNQNIILTDSKQIELGMTTMGIALQAWKGEGTWTQGKKFQNIRAIFPMYDTPFHFITTDKTGIKSVKELNGRTVGVGPRAGTPGTYFPLMFEALGVKPSAIRYGGGSDMAGQVGDGLLDVFAFAAGCRSRPIRRWKRSVRSSSSASRRTRSRR
jgi:TRAP transporter TAXI family solute receptor